MYGFGDPQKGEQNNGTQTSYNSDQCDNAIALHGSIKVYIKTIKHNETDGEKAECENEFGLVIKTDDYGVETTWELQERDDSYDVPTVKPGKLKTEIKLFSSTTSQAKEFNTASSIQRIGIETEGILVSIGRISDEMQFKEAAELDVDLGSLEIKARLPIIDRHSPLAYSIAQYVHWDLAIHCGAETCSRVSLENVWIMQGASS